MWEDGLKDQSLEIAQTNRSPLRVMAGPGTGKTFSLIRRAARIIEEGADPTRLLIVTFTRVSANDIENELERMGLPQANNIVRGTLHSFSFSVLHQHNVFDFTQRIARPLLEFEERFFLEDLKLYGEFGNFHHRRKTLRAFQAAWARELNQQAGWPTTQVECLFETQMKDWLKFHDSMLICEIIPLTLEFLRYNPESPVLHQFDHVLVDEYQDLNIAEQNLVDLLSQNGNLTVVGDQDQAIYEFFLYAHPEGISNFHKTHRNTYDIPLRISRRCSPSVVNVANALISHNTRKSPIPLIPSDNDTHVDVKLIQWQNTEEEANGITEFITKRIEEKRYIPGQILILCPRRQYGYRVRDLLRNKNISAFSYFDEEELDGNPKNIDESLAQQAFTLLTLLGKDKDKVALRTWLGFGHHNLHSLEYKRLRDYCASNGISPYDALDQIDRHTIEIPYTSGIATKYHQLLDTLNYIDKLDVSEGFNYLFPPGQGWAEPFRNMFSLLQPDEIVSYKNIYNHFLETITQPELPSTADFIRIMSLYKSKGLTADHVFILGCIEGLIPAYPWEELSPTDRLRHYEEQRRLLYVAITRARQTLILSSTATVGTAFARHMHIPFRNGDENDCETISSAFLHEMGNSCPSAISGNIWLRS